MPELILVKAAECLPLRERILRPGQPASAYTYAQDGDPRALHFGVRAGKVLVGVASLLPEPRGGAYPGGPGPEAWRLRGMAVEEDRRGHGLGRMLLQAIQAVVQQRGGGLWFTARVHVQAFYERYGCALVSEVFDLPGGGPHVVMTWQPVGTARMRFGPEGTLPGTGEDDEEDAPRGRRPAGRPPSPEPAGGTDAGDAGDGDGEPDLDRDPDLRDLDR